jgi:hypothetical protein
MPIRKDLRKFYGRTWRTVTRPRILARAGHRCESCAIPNNTEVTRIGGCWLDQTVTWTNGVIEHWRDTAGRFIGDPPDGSPRRIRVVLTVAHLNHTSGDDRDENLKALCQWCHLNYDKAHHAESRAARKDNARPILTALKEATA